MAETDLNAKYDFGEKIKKIISYLKTDKRRNESFLPRPFFVEFTGTPSAGKTTLIKELDKFFRRWGLRVLIPQEGAEVVRHIERTTPLYNISTALYALQMLVDLSADHLYDVVIFNRCMFDAYVWMMYWRQKALLTEEEKRMIQEFFLLRFWISKIDAAYFLVCDPEEALRRELRIALTTKLGETTNPETIKALVLRYKTAYKDLSPKFHQLHWFDTTKLPEAEMVNRIARDVTDALEEKAKSSIYVFPKRNHR